MSLNLVVIEGRLTKEPAELLKTAQGQNGPFSSLSGISVAVDRSYKNPDGSRTADFIPLEAVRGTAEMIARWFHKGDPIIVEGELRSRQYVDQMTGGNRTAYEIHVNKASFTLGRSQQAQQYGQPRQQPHAQPQAQPKSQAQPQNGNTATAVNQGYYQQPQAQQFQAYPRKPQTAEGVADNDHADPYNGPYADPYSVSENDIGF